MLILERQYDDIEIIHGSHMVADYDWQFLRKVDILFSQRPSQPIHQAIIEKAIENKIPVWVDMDDDLLSVPKDNPTSAVYNTHSAFTAVMNSLRLATYVSVSTKALKEKYAQFNPNIEVIPNALDDTILSPKPIPPMEKRQKAILWRGSATHLGDLLTYQREILEAARAHPDYFWLFIGYEPWFITQEMRPGTFGVAPWGNHMQYFDLIQKTAALLSMVPLKNIPFNHAKSNIAWLEASLAGSATIAPAWDEWDHPGVIQYKDGPHFLECLDRAMSAKIDTEECREKSWSHIESELFLTNINRKRHAAALRLAKREKYASVHM